MDSVRLYFRYIGISIRAQMQYRASFVMLVLGNGFWAAADFTMLWALFHRFGSLRGWSLAEVALLYAMANLSFSITEIVVRGFDQFPSMIKNAEFDRILLRPRSLLLQILGQELSLSRLGRLAQSLVILFWATGALHMVWTPAKIAFAVGSVACGSCFFAALFMLQATMSFWTIESLELMNILTHGGVETAQYPLSIYRPWLRVFFTVVAPLACVNYLPALALLGRTGHSTPAPILCWLAPAAGPLFLLVCVQVWKFGVRHYCSTGS